MRFSVFHTECDVKTATHWKIASTISGLRNYITFASKPTR